jgi:hypothetical protein
VTETDSLSFADDNPDRFAQDCSPSPSGPSRAEDRPILGVRRRRPRSAHGNFRTHCSLAGMHMVKKTSVLGMQGNGGGKGDQKMRESFKKCNKTPK